MKHVLIGGGSGMIGRHLTKHLLDRGYQVSWLSRNPRTKSMVPSFYWNPSEMVMDQSALNNTEVVINLAGAGIADKRWTQKRKKLIIESRVNSNLTLLKHLQSDDTERIYLAASAIGIYGNRQEIVDEQTAIKGDAFLVRSVRQWEAAIRNSTNSSFRTVIFRMGVVLSREGGAYPKLSQSMPFGIAPYFGNGKQIISWIHVDDLVRLFQHAIETPEMAGTINAVAPHTVSNKQFIQITKRFKSPYAIMIPVPAFALRILLGEMAATILDSTNVVSRKLSSSHFLFQFASLDEAVEALERKKK